MAQSEIIFQLSHLINIYLSKYCLSFFVSVVLFFICIFKI